MTFRQLTSDKHLPREPIYGAPSPLQPDGVMLHQGELGI